MGCWADENQYNNMYRCKITNPGTGKVVGKPQPAKLCAGSSSACVKGPKQPNVSEGEAEEVNS